jgi:hypothetical protein
MRPHVHLTVVEPLGTSSYVPLTEDHHIPLPPQGEHLWVAAGLWRIPPIMGTRSRPVRLDGNNLLSIHGPFCYVCEQHATPHTLHTPCPGAPRE